MNIEKNINPMNISKKYLRDLPNWFDAPVPICMNGDYRALTFCCKPGSSLTFGFKCLRDKRLKEIGMSSQKFIEIKEEFSKKYNWDAEICCFGSLSYCCMRTSGCDRRDSALKRRYPNKSKDEAMTEYFRLKKELARILLEKSQNPLKDE